MGVKLIPGRREELGEGIFKIWFLEEKIGCKVEARKKGEDFLKIWFYWVLSYFDKLIN